MDFASPLLLLLISPVALAGWYAIRRGISRYLIISRVIILSLLIVALASPFTLGTTTIKDDAPRVTVITDQTMSMDLFDKDAGKKVFEALRTKTPTTQRQFAGISSPIGDEVIQAADNNNLVLVSDGNNNYGKDLFDAISFVSRTGTRVFAVQQKPLHNDASVEIDSPKNLIMGNENVFNIVVRQAGDTTSYRLDVEINGNPVGSETITQTERMKIIPVSYTFNSLGAHRVKAAITPGSEDRFDINNEFYKSVFVVPKPKVLVVMDESLLTVTSESELPPLHQIINRMYDATTSGALPDDLKPYKAVIIDNKHASQLGVENLKTFVSNSGGLVVVGGEASYDRGNYNNSPVEAILPIISRAAEYQGGRSVVIVIDASSSTLSEVRTGDAITRKDIQNEEQLKELCPSISYSSLRNYKEDQIVCWTTQTTVIGLIDANAMSIVNYIDRGSSVGVIAFGSTKEEKPLVPMGSERNRKILEDFITQIGPKGDVSTSIDLGLKAAEEMLKTASGSKLIIILSDGQIPRDENTLKIAKSLKDQGIEFVIAQISTRSKLSPEDKKSEIWASYDELAKFLDTEVVVYGTEERVCSIQNCLSGDKRSDIMPTPTPTPEISHEYPIAVVDTNHFITKYTNITALITGYNDVTPKLGSDSLVATAPQGKPILTTWGFGLGRVASFTTDNGAQWSGGDSGVYRGDNSRLISSMINWAIGDPRPRGDVVVQAEDIWAGTPGKVVITSSTLPVVNLDGTQLDLSRTGPSTYETSISPEKGGFHDLSGYGIAVNYPLEYREVGSNEKLKSVIESNGGRVYSEDEVEGLMLLDIKEKAVRTVEEPKSEKEPFLLAALALFLVEVIIRRMKDYRKDRPQIEDNPPRAAPVVEAEAAE